MGQGRQRVDKWTGWFSMTCLWAPNRGFGSWATLGILFLFLSSLASLFKIVTDYKVHNDGGDGALALESPYPEPGDRRVREEGEQ